jgi:hypothetical protein
MYWMECLTTKQINLSIKTAARRFFYVQDERYATVPGMAKSGDVQDERYAAVPRMAWSGDVQDERHVAIFWIVVYLEMRIALRFFRGFSYAEFAPMVVRSSKLVSSAL